MYEEKKKEKRKRVPHKDVIQVLILYLDRMDEIVKEEGRYVRNLYGKIAIFLCSSSSSTRTHKRGRKMI